jgi:hypothetical protein
MVGTWAEDAPASSVSANIGSSQQRERVVDAEGCREGIMIGFIGNSAWLRPAPVEFIGRPD